MVLKMKKLQQLKKPKQNNLLNDFIQREMYLQNPPMTTDKFIDFCKKQSIQTTKEELEFFEKEKLLFPIIRVDRPVGEEERIKFKKSDGKEYWRPVSDGLQKGETEIKRYSVKFYSRYDVFKEDVVGSYHNDLLLNWLEEGNLFDPSTKDFQNWDTFIGEELEHEKQKIISFYSNFQIYWLDILKKSFSITLNLAGDDIKARSLFVLPDSRQGNGSFSFDNIDNFIEKLKEVAKKEPFKEYFALDVKKKKLRKGYKEFNTILQFLLSIQSVYFPYAKSGGRTIQITGDDKKWQEARRNFKLNDVLEKLNLKIEDIAKWYKIFSDEAQKILGVKRDDWIQLWKNIVWSEKDKLEGNIRLGVEYLQWAVMLKRIIKEHLQKEILDIDEMSNISGDDILKFEPERMNQYDPRATRNKRYSDKDKNYYHDRYKRLFYLANDFGLDYQPRVTVFVEGKTEETIFPEIFEQYIGNKPENLGIEFINIQGISQFFGQKISIKNSGGKYQKGFISNFNHLASYNLNKWQIIPLFVGDDENNISYLLQNGVSIFFNQNQYSFPKDWQYIWGVTNNNKSFQGKDFEMANFSDDEIAKVLSEILNKQISPSDIQTQRSAGKGIKQVDKDVENHKIDITKRLIENLFDEYKKTKNKFLFGRPIFKALDKITNLAILNYPPVDREIELKNKEYFEKELQKTP